MSLQELHIHNFKFFREVESNSPLLNINGRNLLIYGENGSGKSTIYWALYTLLEASFKKDKGDIKKYFDRRKKECLVNIHAPSGSDCFIKALINDGQGNIKPFKVSAQDLQIMGDTEVIESNMASDFINYRILFQLHNLKHSKQNDLFDWFKEEVLPYVKKDANPCLTKLMEFNNGPPKVTDIQGNKVYPVAGLRTSKNEAEQKNYQVYKDFKNEVRDWNKWLKEFLENTSSKANQILNTSFGYDFKFKFEIKPFKFNVSEDNYEFKLPEIRIKVPKYDGQQTTKVKKPHTFLNEAKWSAIGISIRFAILDIKLYQANLKSLIIDDMLLSLDMKHRHIVIDLLLKTYVNDFQIIMMTHDRYFYELMKTKINAFNQSGDWLSLEMYEEQAQTGTKPLLIKAKTNLEKAISFYMQKEFAASANHLRKVSEEFVHRFLPKHKHYDRNFKKLNLSQMIDRSRALARLNSWPSHIISDLDLMRQNIFNPQSHFDITTPVFQTELIRGIDLMKEIKNRTGFNL